MGMPSLTKCISFRSAKTQMIKLDSYPFQEANTVVEDIIVAILASLPRTDCFASQPRNAGSTKRIVPKLSPEKFCGDPHTSVSLPVPDALYTQQVVQASFVKAENF